MLSTPHRVLLHALFFLSGAAGLVWEIAWLRAFTRVHGQTTVAAAWVAGVTVAALGLGAWWGGRRASRPDARPVRWYGLAELAAAALGLLGLTALGALGPQLSAFGGYTADARGWLHPSLTSHTLRGLTAVALVGPPAALMGATLPWLTQAVTQGADRRAGWRLGVLYGVNTLGAALGAWAADAWWVPGWGLQRTAWLAAGANIAAGVVALSLRSRPNLVAGRDAKRDAKRHTIRVPPRLLAALFVTGLAALGVEILWLRFLGSALGAYRAVFAGILALHLLGVWAGATLGGAIALRPQATRAALVAAPLLAAALTLAGLLMWDAESLTRAQLALAPLARAGEPLHLRVLAVQLGAMLPVVLPASVAMGACFPLAASLARLEHDPAGRVGALYLANAMGNGLGGLLVALVLLPLLGLQSSLLAMCGLFALAALLVASSTAQRASVGACAASLLLITAALPPDHLLFAAFPSGRLEAEGVLTAHEGQEHTLVITGQPEGPARLWTSGHPMTSTSPHAQRYMRLMAHLPLLQMEAPERALVICFGVGNTAHAASLHGAMQLDVADLDVDVLTHAPWFEHANKGVLDAPTTRVIVDDGRHWLDAQDAEYDLITLEPPPIAHAGVGSLYSTAFYRQVRAHLSPQGAISQWLPAYQVPDDAVRSLVAAFVEVFPEATLHVGDGRELILVGWAGATPPFDPHAVTRRLLERPDVADDLRRHGVESATDLALTFAADAQTLRGVSAGAAPLTDDRPLLGASQISHIMETRLPAGLLRPLGVESWWPSALDTPERAAAFELLDGVLRSTDYQRFSNLAAPSATRAVWPTDLQPDPELLARHPTLSWLVGAEP